VKAYITHKEPKAHVSFIPAKRLVVVRSRVSPLPNFFGCGLEKNAPLFFGFNDYSLKRTIEASRFQIIFKRALDTQGC
jgi:hypothetical protein